MYRKLVILALGLVCILPLNVKAENEIITSDPIILLQNEVRETKNWEDRGEDTTIQISQEDADRLMRIAYAEGGNQGVEGQLMIMETVWNRVQSDLEIFPDTIQEVIEQKNAFSSVSVGTYQTAEPNWESHVALAEFEKNKNLDSNLIGFETVKNGKTLLQYFDFYLVYKDHNFYKLKLDKK